MATNKRTKAVAATVAAAALLLGGTFAWTSISQQATNEAIVDINPGGRLHDDFNGTNKDVYVENFNSVDDPQAVPIYARVKLTEYMEIGQEAGLKEKEDGDRKANVVGAEAGDQTAQALKADPENWNTYIPGTDTVESGNAYSEYWEWTLGNDSVDGRYYMPTFDKNKDSLDADINGTYEGVVPGDIVHYDDYEAYDADSKETASEFYDWDSDTVHEDGVKIAYDNGGVKAYDEEMPIDDADVTEKASQLHEAKPITKTATVITMEQWINDYGSQPGDYWVYDTDGWAYWANPINPGETTGMLLDGINMHKVPDDNWYYGINVVGQFATEGDFSAFKMDGQTITDNALDLLAAIAGMEYTVSITNKPIDETVYEGETVNYDAVLKMAGAELDTQPAFTWTVTDAEGNAISGVSIGRTSGNLSIANRIIDTATEAVITATTADGAYSGTKKITIKPAIEASASYNDGESISLDLIDHQSYGDYEYFSYGYYPIQNTSGETVKITLNEPIDYEASIKKSFPTGGNYIINAQDYLDASEVADDPNSILLTIKGTPVLPQYIMPYSLTESGAGFDFYSVTEDGDVVRVYLVCEAANGEEELALRYTSADGTTSYIVEDNNTPVNIYNGDRLTLQLQNSDLSILNYTITIYGITSSQGGGYYEIARDDTSYTTTYTVLSGAPLEKQSTRVFVRAQMVDAEGNNAGIYEKTYYSGKFIFVNPDAEE